MRIVMMTLPSCTESISTRLMHAPVVIDMFFSTKSWWGVFNHVEFSLYVSFKSRNSTISYLLSSRVHVTASCCSRPCVAERRLGNFCVRALGLGISQVLLMTVTSTHAPIRIIMTGNFLLLVRGLDNSGLESGFVTIFLPMPSV